MAFIRKNGIWRPSHVPLGDIELDRTHTLARGILSLVVPGSRYGLSDIARPRTVTPSAGLARSGTASGPGIDWNATGGTARLDIQFGPSQPPSLMTTFAYMQTGANGNISGAYEPVFTFQDGTTAGSATYDRAMALSGFAGIWYPVFYIYDGGFKSTSPPNGIAQGTVGMVAGVWDGTNLICYCNGQNDGQVAASAPFAGYTDAQLNFGYGRWLLAGGGAAAGPSLPTSTLLAGGVYDRALSADENAWLAREPFAMLKTKVSRQFYFMPSFGGGGVVSPPVQPTLWSNPRTPAPSTQSPQGAFRGLLDAVQPYPLSQRNWPVPQGRLHPNHGQPQGQTAAILRYIYGCGAINDVAFNEAALNVGCEGPDILGQGIPFSQLNWPLPLGARSPITTPYQANRGLLDAALVALPPVTPLNWPVPLGARSALPPAYQTNRGLLDTAAPLPPRQTNWLVPRAARAPDHTAVLGSPILWRTAAASPPPVGHGMYPVTPAGARHPRQQASMGCPSTLLTTATINYRVYGTIIH